MIIVLKNRKMNQSINKIHDLINKHEELHKLSFTPSRVFYESIEIGRKRFWQIVRNEKQPTLIELKSIADYFNVDAKSLF